MPKLYLGLCAAVCVVVACGSTSSTQSDPHPAVDAGTDAADARPRPTDAAHDVAVPDGGANDAGNIDEGFVAFDALVVPDAPYVYADAVPVCSDATCPDTGDNTGCDPGFVGNVCPCSCITNYRYVSCGAGTPVAAPQGSCIVRIIASCEGNYPNAVTPTGAEPGFTWGYYLNGIGQVHVNYNLTPVQCAEFDIARNTAQCPVTVAGWTYSYNPVTAAVTIAGTNDAGVPVVFTPACYYVPS